MLNFFKPKQMKMAKSNVDINFTNNILCEPTFSEKQEDLPENVNYEGNTNCINLEEKNIYSRVITDSEYEEDDEEEENDGSLKWYIVIGVCVIAILGLTGVGIFFYFKSGGKHFEAKESPIAKVQKKCKEYTDWACSLQSSSGKGPSQIVHGEIVQRRGIFPHQVLVMFEDERTRKQKMCGGSLISEKFILTAAHCVQNVVLTSGEALLGSLDMWDSNRTLYKAIKKFYVHPEYNSTYGYVSSDISLLELDEEVKFNSDIRPICLNIKLEMNYDPIYASGWGVTEYGQESQYLRMVTVHIYDEAAKDCQKKYKDRKYSDDFIEFMNKSMICGAHITKGTAQGDSGGPLQVKLKSNCEHTWELIGVTSKGWFTKGGPYKDTEPSFLLFSKVEYFVPWISNLVWPD